MNADKSKMICWGRGGQIVKYGWIVNVGEGSEMRLFRSNFTEYGGNEGCYSAETLSDIFLPL